MDTKQELDTRGGADRPTACEPPGEKRRTLPGLSTPTARRDKAMSETPRPLLSILMPVLDEERTLRTIIDRVLALPLDLELVIVDDGSTDSTPEILAGIEDPRVRRFRHEKNQGKGTAMRTAIEHARGEIMAMQDADLEYRPEEFVDLIKPIVEGEVKVVYGSRCLNPENAMKFDRFRFGSWVLTKMSNVLYGARLTDEPTCYKLWHRACTDGMKLRCTGFEFCPELTAKLRKRGYKIIELPISYQGRTVEEGKKINWKDGVIGIWTLLKYRFCN